MRFGTGLPRQWLFEPSPAAMKSKPFGVLCTRYGLVKFHPNTHLFVGDAPVEGLPGRWYEIEEVAEFSSSAINRLAKGGCRQMSLSGISRLKPKSFRNA